MILSMTGFGSGQSQCDDWMLRAEVRSVNHKELQVSFRIPDVLHPRETALQKLVEKHVSRGHLYIWINCDPVGAESDTLVDEEALGAYVRAARRVAEKEGVPFRADLGAMLRLPGVIRDLDADEDLVESLWPSVLEAVEAALVSLVEMRRAEGANLTEQFEELTTNIGSLVDRIEAEQGSFVPGYRDRLRERIARLLEGTSVEVKEDALAREVAVYADRSDVSEEIARLRSHLAQFAEAMDTDAAEPVGRKMEFLGQEMLRESGTIAAKVPAGPQVECVLSLKSNVDRLREQVRNVE